MMVRSFTIDVFFVLRNDGRHEWRRMTGWELGSKCNAQACSDGKRYLTLFSWCSLTLIHWLKWVPLIGHHKFTAVSLKQYSEIGGIGLYNLLNNDRNEWAKSLVVVGNIFNEQKQFNGQIILFLMNNKPPALRIQRRILVNRSEPQ